MLPIPTTARLAFAHADWAGYSVFEEAFTRGHAAGLEQLFADHSEATDCRVYDQQSHADLAPGIPMLVLPYVPIGFTLRHQAGEALARFAALFEARGPPLGA